MTKYTKYPRTYHLPFSAGVTSDDKVIRDYTHFIGEQVVITEKMDGENTTIYKDHVHARSIDSGYHESRNWVKSFAASFQHNIPKNYRICGENLYAKHSLGYDDLESYFLGFSAWNHDTCLNWDDTIKVFEGLGIRPVKTLYIGEFSEKTIIDLVDTLDLSRTEGFVVRLHGDFEIQDFDKKVAKYVRANHVVSDSHWMHQSVVKNKLA